MRDGSSVACLSSLSSRLQRSHLHEGARPCAWASVLSCKECGDSAGRPGTPQWTRLREGSHYTDSWAVKNKNTPHALHEASDEPSSAVSLWLIMTKGSPKKGRPVQDLYQPAHAKSRPRSLLAERPEMGKACGPNFPSSVTFFWSLWPFHNFVGNQNY